MARFSANLGFLWTELDLPEAIHAAHEAGFDAVECHWPYAISAAEIRAALRATGLPMLGLNTRRGDVAAGDNGVAAITGRETEARHYIDEAIAYAAAINCANVHVMAGITDEGRAAENTYRNNLAYACAQARQAGVSILIEPLNHRDVPGYHLSTIDAAIDTLTSLNAGNVKLMFDCYHIQIMQGDLTVRLLSNMNRIGHIQIAAVPDRGEPDDGEINYPAIIAALDQHGWQGYVGAEYKPRGSTDEGLGWMAAYQPR